MTAVVCSREQSLTVEEFRRVLIESGLGATRPIDDEPRLRQMLAAAGLVMTARTPDGHLLGVARCLSDSFAGVRPADVPAFVLAQLLGAGLATALFSWLAPPAREPT